MYLPRTGAWDDLFAYPNMRAMLLLMVVAAIGDATNVVVHRFTDDIIAPEIAVHNGTVHMVYGTTSKNAYYQRSVDDGVTWSTRVKLNPGPGPMVGMVTTTMGERGPKISIGSADGSIHVAYMDLWAPGVLTYVRAVHSVDGGNSFSPPVQASDQHGIDGSTIAADGRGNVLAFWHVNHTSPPPNATEATWLHYAESNDNGNTFGKNQLVTISGGMPPIACSMCMVSTTVETDGQFKIAFRSAVNNIRDFYEISGRAGENNWAPNRINSDHWHWTACPMNGPSLTHGGVASRMDVVAFTTGGTGSGNGFDDYAYWSIRDRNDGTWKLSVPTPTHQRNERYPTATSGGADGDTVVMVWNVGPMAVSGTARVIYAIYNASTHPPSTIGQSVDLGTSFAGTKATLWTASDGAFHIVTTARPSSLD
eukprot:m.75076 g.75076  ORF g.75076 m.75076 type:complete len:422 (+) comp24733_c2_seq1:43-1308(+)